METFTWWPAPTPGPPAGGGRRRCAGYRPLELDVVPELAGHRLVHLVEALAVVGEDAAPHLVARGRAGASGTSRGPPGSGGPRRRCPPHRHGAAPPPARRSRSRPTGRPASGSPRRAPPPAPRGSPPRFAAERPSLVRAHGRHALVAAGPGVGIAGPADPRLLRVLELAPAREREVVHPGPRELGPEPGRVLRGVASRRMHSSPGTGSPPRSVGSRRRAPPGRPRAAAAPGSRASPP